MIRSCSCDSRVFQYTFAKSKTKLQFDSLTSTVVSAGPARISIGKVRKTDFAPTSSSLLMTVRICGFLSRITWAIRDL